MNHINIIDGKTSAAYFKYFRQFTNKWIINKVELHRVPSRALYNKNAKIFDKFAEICIKYKIDPVKYIKFYITVLLKTEKDVPNDFLDMSTINKFIEHLQIRAQYKKIYNYFIKSANNIADDCIKYDYSSVKDYLQYLIKHGQLANQYLCGRISCYYLCALKNFKKIIPKMDKMSQNEFSTILLRYDKYNVDVQDAFKLYKSNYVNPIKFTEDILWDKRTKINNKQ